jgi:hypothetical protein
MSKNLASILASREKGVNEDLIIVQSLFDCIFLDCKDLIRITLIKG